MKLTLKMTLALRMALNDNDIGFNEDKPFLQEVSPPRGPDPLSAKLAEVKNSVKYDQATSNF